MTNGQKKIKNYLYIKRGAELKALRGSQNIKDFALILKIPIRTYYRYESGERKVPDGLFELAQILSKNKKVEGVHEARVEYAASSNPMSQVIKGIKEIYDSKDIILIQAFTLNIAAFQMAAKLSGEQKKEFDELHDMCEEILGRVCALEAQWEDNTFGETKSQEDTTKKAAT